MLENIKMLLAIASDDTSKDAIINYWINYYTKMIIKYCHITELNEDLTLILEQMIVQRLGGFGTTSTSTEKQDGVKSITRGDYRIEFKETMHDKQQNSLLDEIAINFQGQLNLWRRLDY